MPEKQRLDVAAKQAAEEERQRVEQVKGLFGQRLAPGKSVPVRDLWKLVPEELADAATQWLNPIVYEDMGRLPYGQFHLGTAAVEALVQDGVCEKRTEGGRELIRLKETTANKPGTPAGDPAGRDGRPKGNPKPKANRTSTPSAHAADPAQPHSATTPVEEQASMKPDQSKVAQHPLKDPPPTAPADTAPPPTPPADSAAVAEPTTPPAATAANGVGKLRTVKVADIKVGNRHRQQLGDIVRLAKSIEARGLLQPLVVTPDLQLIAGQRRLVALQELRREDVPVYVVTGLDDALARLHAEQDENTCREPFTPSEAVALGEAIEDLERQRAAERRRASQAKPGQKVGAAPAKQAGQSAEPPQGAGKLPAPSEKGDTRDRVAAAVGMSGRTYEKGKAVVKAAEEDPEGCGPIAEEMDRTGKVDPAYNEVQRRRHGKAGQRRRAAPSGPHPKAVPALTRLIDKDKTLAPAVQLIAKHVPKKGQRDLAKMGPDAVRQKAKELWLGPLEDVERRLRDGEEAVRAILAAPVSDEATKVGAELLRKARDRIGGWIKDLENPTPAAGKPQHGGVAAGRRGAAVTVVDSDVNKGPPDAPASDGAAATATPEPVPA
jgi:ParB family chromosome partitioning protein